MKARRIVLLTAAVVLSSTACGKGSDGSLLPTDDSVTAAASPSKPPSKARTPPPDGKALFAQHCAGCHGIKGDGKGETPTERPPRDFAKGGFAFGNSREALFRTVSKGMPGRSDMQPFENRLSPPERWAVVDYVLTLVPQRSQDWMAGAEMRVDDEARCVWGKIPSLKKGWPEIPRGLVVGLPNGITLVWGREPAYRQAVLRGAFLKRSDWGGRGGQALELRGEVILARKPRTASPFLADGEPLRSRWRSASTLGGDRAVLRYELLDEVGPVASVTDEVAPDQDGWRRTLTVERAPKTSGDLVFTLAGPQDSGVALEREALVFSWQGRPTLRLSVENGRIKKRMERFVLPVPSGAPSRIAWRVQRLRKRSDRVEETR